MIETISSAVAWVQFGLLTCLALLGLHRGWMVYLYLRHRRAAFHPGPVAHHDDAMLPRVTVQLPIYNERNVARRLIEATAALDYPHDKLQIQVLDDSTDDTVEVVQRVVGRMPADLQVEHVRRAGRTGYKAGALANGLGTAGGELIAVFDADFVPPREFLRETVPLFVARPRLGMVQARWEHLNPDSSQLTALQAMLLDGHFVVEHVARSRTGCFFNFNGTAGIFRRTCIEDAGGWQHDTLTEDMDLSYRAQLRGWQFHYRPDLACPAELPIEMNAFLNQQHRWAKGSVQTGRKLLGRILRAPIPVVAKAEAIFHLLGNVAFLLLLCLILVALPVQVLRLLDERPLPLLLAIVESAPLLLSTLCVLVYYGIAQQGLARLRLADVARLPLLIAIGAGMCLNNSVAVIGAFSRRTGEFLRTPKHNVMRGMRVTPSGYRSRRGVLPYLELGLGLWASATATLALLLGYPWTTAFHGLFALGLFWCGGACIAEDLRRRERLTPTQEPVSVPS